MKVQKSYTLEADKVNKAKLKALNADIAKRKRLQSMF
jgi:hypothetical protein